MRILAILAACFVSSICYADSSVRISFESGYRIGGPPTQATIFVSRGMAAISDANSVSAFDRYFAQIRGVLEAAHAPSVWAPAPAIHADKVRIEVALESRKYTLVVGYGDLGPEISLRPPPVDKRMLAVLKDILRLTNAFLVQQIENGGK